MSFWPETCHHQLQPLKHICSINPETLPETTDPDYEFEYIDIGNVTLESGVVGRERMTFGNAPSRARKPVRPNDVIVSTVRTYLKAVASVPPAADRWVASTGFAVLRNKPFVEPRYLCRAVQSNPFVESVVAVSTGVSYPAINPSTLGRIPVPLPDKEVQRLIADFLDQETDRINKLIEKKQQLVQLLQAKLENDTVRLLTRGADNHARMIDEPVLEWIAERPEHWRMHRLKHFFRENTRYSVDGEEILYSLRMNEGLVPHNDVSDKVIPHSDLVGYKKISPGQIVMNRMRAAIGLFGLADAEGIVSPDYSVFDLSKAAHPAYFLRLFKTAPMMTAFRILSKGLGTGQSGFMRLNADRFGEVRVAIPGYDEQRRISNLVERRIEQIGRIQNRTEHSVELLKEFRAALITAAVTGQIDVATWGKRGETDRRLDKIEEELAAPRGAEQMEARP